MKTTKAILKLCFLLLAFGSGLGADVALGKDSTSPGQPFQLLQQQIDEINQKLSQLDQQNQQIADLQQQVEELSKQLAGIKKNGAYGYEISRNSIADITVQPGQTATIRIQCPLGKRIVGGGARVYSDLLGGLTSVESFPAPWECEGYDGDNNLIKVPMDKYVAIWRNDTATSLSGEIYGWAICIGEEYTGQLYGDCETENNE